MKRSRGMAVLVAALVAGPAAPGPGGGAPAASDWPQWRGPQRSGLAPPGPVLAATWPAGGPRRIWLSEPIAAAEKGGYGSVSIAAGRAYVFASFKRFEPVTTRTFDLKALEGLGWTPFRMPDELTRAVDKARLSPELAGLTRNQRLPWIEQWIKDNVPAKQAGKWRQTILKRLTDGKNGVSPAALDKLGTVKDKPFPGQDALEKWLDDQAVTGNDKDRILRAAPTTRAVADDVVYCLDVADGRTVWKKTFPGRPHNFASSCTPLLAGGRCYFVGSGENVHCLDAADGREVWKAPCAKPESSGSFVLVGGLVIGQVGALTALDARTGRVVWKQPRVPSCNNSPVSWVGDGKTYLICNSDSGLHCVDPDDGRVLWSAKGGHASTPVVSGDVAVVNGLKDTGLAAYRISPAKAEKIWGVPTITNASSPLVYDGHVYANRIHRIVCVELHSGTVKWDQKCDIASVASPVIADGKIYCVAGDRGGKGFLMIAADPEKFALLGTVALKIARCSSPTIVAGRAYLRLRNGVACFDLVGRPAQGASVGG